MDVRVVLQLPAPGVQDPGEPREVRPDETRIGGQPLEGHGRRLKHSVVREALMRADKGPQGLRDGEGEEEVRPGQLFFQVLLEPLLSFMLLALGTVAVATGMIDTVVFAAALALVEAAAVMPTAAVLDGADDLVVRGGEVGIARKVLRGEGVEDIADGRHAWNPRMSASMRW
jgi:hypothetical protein